MNTYRLFIETFKQKFRAFYNAPNHACLLPIVFTWPATLPSEYIDLLGNREPQTLALFAFYTVLLKEGKCAWWIEGWNVHFLERIDETLDTKMRLWIWWPMEELGLGAANGVNGEAASGSGHWGTNGSDEKAIHVGTYRDRNGLAEKTFGKSVDINCVELHIHTSPRTVRRKTQLFKRTEHVHEIYKNQVKAANHYKTRELIHVYLKYSPRPSSLTSYISYLNVTATFVVSLYTISHFVHLVLQYKSYICACNTKTMGRSNMGDGSA
jgi:hypothetical protein